VPWYLGILEFPEPYERGDPEDKDMESAYWVFRTLADWAEEDYRNRSVALRNVWKKYEDEAYNSQEKVEKKALEIYHAEGEAQARTFLTEYSGKLGMEVLEEAQGILDRSLRQYCLCSFV
jgi:dipeptidase